MHYLAVSYCIMHLFISLFYNVAAISVGRHSEWFALDLTNLHDTQIP
jgi:ribonuclease PH